MSSAKVFIKLIMLLVIISGTFLGLKYMNDNKPGIGQAPREKTSYLVDVSSISLVTKPVNIEAMGTVMPVRETIIKARVSGEIVKVSEHLKPGGYFSKGQQIVAIDQSDYELAVSKAQAALASAQSNLALEMGQQQVAKKEWQMISSGRKYTEQEKQLALRVPQLNQVKSAVDTAKANLADTELDLARTSVIAPYNCIVLEKNVELGAILSTQDSIATLVDVDKFWVEVSIAQDDLKWVVVPHLDKGYGSKAVINYNDSTIDGMVVSLMSDLESQGRMARVLVEVIDPLNLRDKTARQPLLLDNYVSVNIAGKELNNVAQIPRTAFRDGNAVWVAVGDAENGYKLAIRNAKTIWRDENTVAVSEGLQQGDLLITSAIASPIEGMALRLSDDSGITNN